MKCRICDGTDLQPLGAQSFLFPAESYAPHFHRFDNYVCGSCGVVPLVTSDIEGGLYAVVNVNTFEGIDRAELDESPTDFEGESTEGRLARRQRNWIPEVNFV